jgi:predicted  nucleic acid-binding Zn-ribbon protein
MQDDDRITKNLKGTANYRRTKEIQALVEERERKEERRQILRKELARVSQEIKALDTRIQQMKERTIKGQDLYNFNKGAD